MQKLVPLLALFLVLGLFISCIPEAESPLYKEPEIKVATKGVAAINLSYFTAASWDDDPEVDGIDFVLQPIDEADKVVKTTGMLTAKLWLEEEGGAKGEFIQEWVDLPVTEADYAFPMGYTIRLEYTDFEPEAKQQYGIVEVVFVIPDGQSFTDSFRMVLGR
jgi:hypothetical protein